MVMDGSANAAFYVNTTTATNITQNSATLNSNVTNTSGTYTVSAYFVWGTTSSYGNTTGASTVSQSSTANISQNISGLTCGTTYHFAVNWQGAFYGPDTTFTTAACPASSSSQVIDSSVIGTISAQYSMAIRAPELQIMNVDNHLQDLTQKARFGTSSLAYDTSESLLNKVVLASAGDQLPSLGQNPYQAESDATKKPYSVWVAGSFDWGRFDAGQNVTNRFNTAEGTIGLDLHLPKGATVGLAATYSHDKTDIDNSGSSVNGRQIAVSGYAVSEFARNWIIDGQLGAGWLNFDNNRYSAISASTLSSSRNGNTYFASIGVRKEFLLSAIKLAPYVRAQRIYSNLGSYSEGSSAGALTYGNSSISSNSYVAGVDGSYDVPLSNGAVLTPNCKIEMRHNSVSGFNQSVNLVQNSTAPLVVGVSAVPYDVQTIGLGLRYVSKNRLIASLGWQISGGSYSYVSNLIHAELRMSF